MTASLVGEVEGRRCSLGVLGCGTEETAVGGLGDSHAGGLKPASGGGGAARLRGPAASVASLLQVHWPSPFPRRWLLHLVAGISVAILRLNKMNPEVEATTCFTFP
ncbi:hypothetical protein PR202_gb15520 [Eleusine coracana subsp. coracana]|uniref:Uncharacterized protein n=1 Tax=Eleusine coracana subsp. coracana TaxID=191504 RepID=A0AAV5EY82_ELECO|nr:hypothetical protein PR202_gb15520 [Eleusine coracana subsp. coracana]